MLNPMQIEEAFQGFVSNLPEYVHDEVIQVNLAFLHELGLLNSLKEERTESDDFTQCFHVIESAEKVTLFNEQFAVWIIPRMEGDIPTTFVLIAFSHQGKMRLEVIFATNGVYNTPRYVLKILQHFLVDVLDTEATLTSLDKE
jgi:hypothetical protein